MEFAELDAECTRIADAIRETIEKRNDFCKTLHKVRFKELFRDLAPLLRNGICDDFLSIPVTPTELNGLHVAAVDGGLVFSRLQYLDILLTRAVAVIFRYTQSGEIVDEQLMSHESTPEITVKTEALSRGEFDTLTSIRRAITEIDLARKVVEQKSVNMIILDGSILPHKADRPIMDSPIDKEYQAMLKGYQQFYEACESSGVLAVGCVKDSKITQLRDTFSRALPTLLNQWRQELDPLLNMSYRNILLGMFDSELFYRILESKERSCCFFIEEICDNPKGGLSSNHAIYGFYLKTVSHDFPLRIEFLANQNNSKLRANQIASVIYPQSSHHDEYGLPSILIEADARARLHYSDLDIIIENILTRIGIPDPWRLRRERSVFHL